MAKETYRIPMLHFVLACLATLLLGIGIGYSLSSSKAESQEIQSTKLALQNSITTPTPSVLPTGEKLLTVPVYFNNTQLNPENQNCSAVFQINRQVRPNNVPLQTALTILFAGPTKEEQALGYQSVFSEDTKDLLRSASFVNGAVSLDLRRTSLDAVLKAGANTACGKAQFQASIEKTIMAVVGVKSVDTKDFSVDGSKALYKSLIK